MRVTSVYCSCGQQLAADDEQRRGECVDCRDERIDHEEWEHRFTCDNASCGERLIMINPHTSNFCSDECEEEANNLLLSL